MDDEGLWVAPQLVERRQSRFDAAAHQSFPELPCSTLVEMAARCFLAVAFVSWTLDTPAGRLRHRQERLQQTLSYREPGELRG